MEFLQILPSLLVPFAICSSIHQLTATNTFLIGLLSFFFFLIEVYVTNNLIYQIVSV